MEKRVKFFFHLFLKHIRKPDEVRERIVELMGDLPRIELFARESNKGWDVWGDELPK
jgi:N6-adenosine-specific RNA methylase IME4